MISIKLDLDDIDYLINRLEDPEDCGQSPEWGEEQREALREALRDRLIGALIQNGEDTDDIPEPDLVRVRKMLS